MTTTATANPIGDFLSETRLGPRQAHKALTLWPLHLREGARRSASPGYQPLREALDEGTVLVDEVDEGGSVPLVRVTN